MVLDKARKLRKEKSQIKKALTGILKVEGSHKELMEDHDERAYKSQEKKEAKGSLAQRRYIGS